MGSIKRIDVRHALHVRHMAQGSIEYIMILSAVSIIIVVALAMMLQLKGTALHMFMNSSNQSVISELTRELGNLTSSVK